MATNITPQNIMQELQNPKNWKRTAKKNYEVYMCKPGTGVKVQDKISGTPYVVNETQAYVISGTVGDIETVDARTLAANYVLIDGTPINGQSMGKRANADGLIDWTHLKAISKNGGSAWAFHLPLNIKNFPVNTRKGGVYANQQGLKHGVGDFLVCSDMGGQPNLNDVQVVNGLIFPTTYDLRAFPGMFPADVIKAETPKPTVSLVEKVAKTAQKEDKDSNTEKLVRKICNFAAKNAKVKPEINIEYKQALNTYIWKFSHNGKNHVIEYKDTGLGKFTYYSSIGKVKTAKYFHMDIAEHIKELCQLTVTDLNSLDYDFDMKVLSENVAHKINFELNQIDSPDTLHTKFHAGVDNDCGAAELTSDNLDIIIVINRQDKKDENITVTMTSSYPLNVNKNVYVKADKNAQSAVYKAIVTNLDFKKLVNHLHDGYKNTVDDIVKKLNSNKKTLGFGSIEIENISQALYRVIIHPASGAEHINAEYRLNFESGYNYFILRANDNRISESRINIDNTNDMKASMEIMSEWFKNTELVTSVIKGGN